ncbi:MAG TPA: Maf family protein [Steroidobacteraceae bacterium]|nr:Maf family protein [Steroidobacteraceae bacterium]
MLMLPLSVLLASASPRRRDLLRQMGIEPEIVPADVDESRLPAEPPRDYVHRLAHLKAETAWHALPAGRRSALIAADTAVVLGSEILGKPTDRESGLGMLARLSGRTHEVMTGVALRIAGRVDVRVNVSRVTFRALQREECEAYWESGEPRDKAGGYAVQGLAATFIRDLEGSFSGVMGLPLYETAELLRAAGIDPLSAARAGR